ncbi:response regulator transcription factor [Vagococcus elongatus]|uniref:DNA-binding response regulator n=1 Tax=Vagococcus elongatus TaxID=180344 RepID=A0A430B239_9ENTE|nr:response regulator transcription factor [Vagococcus elongatus]RSU14359.1 DNA-binding response regulator [Vagococcus elongatus]
MKIMLVEDDKKIAWLVSEHLKKYGYTLVLPPDLKEVMTFFEKEIPDLVLMDVNLPFYDGFYWTKKIRQISKCPIIFLSARESSMDQVVALDYGADDYITKPFSYDLLLAKVKSHIRRVYGEYAIGNEERVYEKNGLRYYPERLEIHYGESVEFVTKKEGELVELLLVTYPEVVSREAILEKLWDTQDFVDDNTLSVNITRLRKKFQDVGLPDSILTIRGKGYKLVLGDLHD